MSTPVHGIAVGLLVSGDRVLLAHRHPQRRHYPDCWDAVGGHIEPGETPDQALVRECHEEIGVRVSRARAVALTIDDPELVMHAFVIEDWSGNPTNCAPEEHDELGWFRSDELAGLTLAHPALEALIATATEPADPPFAPD